MPPLISSLAWGFGVPMPTLPPDWKVTCLFQAPPLYAKNPMLPAVSTSSCHPNEELYQMPRLAALPSGLRPIASVAANGSFCVLDPQTDTLLCGLVVPIPTEPEAVEVM